MKRLFFLLISINIFSQNINVNNSFLNEKLREFKILNSSKFEHSLNIRPIDFEYASKNNELFDNNFFSNLISNKKETIKIKLLELDYHIDFNSHHPYNRNNGSMIPNKGYQHIISPGIFMKLGFVSLQLKPEHHYSENHKFKGFWEGHDNSVWGVRYRLWNHIDMPERFGNKRHNNMNLGQSNISINLRNISFGISSENLWYLRNSIMMSNNAKGFNHIFFKTRKPLKTFFGKIEWNLISGRLDNSGYIPPGADRELSGRKLYIQKTNQLGIEDDWRYLQALIVSIQPKFFDGFSFGLIRWAQMYSALVNGKYTWLEGRPNYFPVFENYFRGKDKFENYEAQTN